MTEALVQPIHDDDDDGHGRSGALEALLDVAREPDVVDDNRIVATVFNMDDYKQIIALAWRYQFNEDRSRFKREILELEENVSGRILTELEQPE